MNPEEEDHVFSEYQRLTPAVLLEKLESRIIERCALLEDIYARHIQRWPGTYLHRHILRETVESYFCDVYRLKFFRPVNWIDCHKQAAYTIKWISRMRPIQLETGAAPKRASLMANAYFGVAAAMWFMEIRDVLVDRKWWKKYITNLIYLLHFHSVQVEHLCSEMCLMQAVHNPPKKQ